MSDLEQTTHEREIAKLVSEGCRVARFRTAILDAVVGKHGSHVPIIDGEGSYIACDRCLLKEDTGNGKIVPDAFRIDVDRMEIIAYEVEVSNPVSEWKIEKYLDWFWAIDEYEWLLRLVIVNRFGHRSEVDLFAQNPPRDTPAERIEEVRSYLGIRRPGEAPEAL